VPTKKPSPSEGRAIITIKEAAEILGVCEMTLRRWDRAGKFSPRRHPINGYRCYSRAEVLKLRRLIDGRAA
jgi:DNA-binding transcriptional MerR regulator